MKLKLTIAQVLTLGLLYSQPALTQDTIGGGESEEPPQTVLPPSGCTTFAPLFNPQEAKQIVNDKVSVYLEHIPSCKGLKEGQERKFSTKNSPGSIYVEGFVRVFQAQCILSELMVYKKMAEPSCNESCANGQTFMKELMLGSFVRKFAQKGIYEERDPNAIHIRLGAGFDYGYNDKLLELAQATTTTQITYLVSLPTVDTCWIDTPGDGWIFPVPTCTELSGAKENFRSINYAARQEVQVGLPNPICSGLYAEKPAATCANPKPKFSDTLSTLYSFVSSGVEFCGGTVSVEQVPEVPNYYDATVPMQ